MRIDEKLHQLKCEITEKIAPLIDGDCILLEVPHHSNVGDFLIWEGERDFLKSISQKCISEHSDRTFDFPVLAPDVIILMNGGGSFGDVWKESLDFKLKVVKSYPNNKIVFFPQSVAFNDSEIKKNACGILKSHKRLTVCARDSYSYDILLSLGIGTILVPDIALFIDMNKYRMKRGNSLNNLLVQRDDREKCRVVELDAFSSKDTVCSDWPTASGTDRIVRLFFVLDWVLKDCKSLHWFVDFVANCFYRKYVVWSGMRFINLASSIHATRLHAGILGLLLHKNVVLYENLYGKLGHFYHTWLSDCENVKMNG